MFPVIANPITPVEYLAELFGEYWWLGLIIVLAVVFSIVLIVKISKKR